MLPDRVSNPGPLTYESGALPIALRGSASAGLNLCRRGTGYCIYRADIDVTNDIASISIRHHFEVMCPVHCKKYP